MTNSLSTRTILKAAALLVILTTSTFGQSAPSDPNQYLNAVREFADSVLKYGRDTYGPKHTPLFVDGLNIHTHEPVKWKYNGEVWYLSNLASQQNLFRVLDALTTLTGDPKYRQAAMDAIEYAFEHLRTPSGLLYWGHSTAYDVLQDSACGNTERESIKLHYPHFELMWEVDSDATKKLIEALWSAHILDWSNLDMNRIGSLRETLEEPWNHGYRDRPVFFESKLSWGRGIIHTGTALCCGATTLYRMTGLQQPLVWSKRLIKRFVDTRHPKTGISVLMYNSPWHELGEDMKEHFEDPRTTVFPFDFYETRYLYYPERVHAHAWLSILIMGRTLGDSGEEFTTWALEELTAWGKTSYRREDNSFVPMLTDGTNLEGYVWNDPPGFIGEDNIIKPYLADESFFWLYCVAFSSTDDEFMWEMVRDIAIGNNYGDVGETPADTPQLHTDTDATHAYAVLVFWNSMPRQVDRHSFRWHSALARTS